MVWCGVVCFSEPVVVRGGEKEPIEVSFYNYQTPIRTHVSYSVIMLMHVPVVSCNESICTKIERQHTMLHLWYSRTLRRQVWQRVQPLQRLRHQKHLLFGQHLLVRSSGLIHQRTICIC
jgi:hypothetical protein